MERERRILLLLLGLLLVLLVPLGAQQGERIFWENPFFLDLDNPRFPQAGGSSRGMVVLAHEYENIAGNRREAYVSLAVSVDGLNWQSWPRTLGPFPFTGSESPIASLLLRPDGTIYIAVAEGESTIGIYRSRTLGYTLSKISEIMTPQAATVAPRLYANSAGELVLFASRDIGSGFADASYLGIFYTVSEDGREWSDFRQLVPEGTLRETYLPTLSSRNGEELVVFQAFKAGGPGGNPPSTYQLYLSRSGDGGRSWSAPELISDFSEPAGLGDDLSWEFYDNQRPALHSSGDETFLVWERRWARSRQRNIYLSRLAADGSIDEAVRFISNRDSIGPRLTTVGERLFLSWYEGSERDLGVRLAEGDRLSDGSIDWYYQQGSGRNYLFVDTLQNSSAFALPISYRGSLHMLWENDRYSGTELADSRLVVRSPDISVEAPEVRGVNFVPGDATPQDIFRVGWTEPTDASTIAGYSYLFTRSSIAEPIPVVGHFRDEQLETEKELKLDGNWYFKIIAQDLAGNWSESATAIINRDTTPPSPPDFIPPETDENGYLTSNTLTINWERPPAEDTAGYTYTYTLLDPAGREVDPASVEPADPPRRILTTDEGASFSNRDNGTWMLSVAAVDEVGNISDPSQYVFRLNKYIPVTIINRIAAERDDIGRTVMRVEGRGFTADGEISRILLDRDGRPPYDYSFSLEEGFYTIAGNRLIEDFTVQDIEEGNYGLGLDHTRRGITWSEQSLYFEPTGVVKFGDFSYVPASPFTLFAYDTLGISVNALITLLILAGLAVALTVTLVMIRGVLVEGARIQEDVEAIIEGRLLTGPSYTKRMEEMRKKGLGLRIKFVLLITVLILIIVLMVAVSLGYYMTRNQQRSLAEGLQDRSALLLESLAVGAREPVDSNDLTQMGILVSQIEAMEDATEVIITGRAAQNPTGEIHALWAASDPESLIEDLTGSIRIDYRPQDADEDTPREFALIDAAELESYRERFDVLVTPFYGQSVYRDEFAEEEESLNNQINEELAGRFEQIQSDISQMQREQLILGTLDIGGTISPEQLQFIQDRFPEYQDEAARNQRLAQINEDIVRFNAAQRELIREAGNLLASRPAFDPENFDPSIPEYIFYRPIVGDQRTVQGQEFFYRGMVRLTVSTEGIVEEIVASRRTLLTLTGIVAAIAAIIGVVGALVLATIIIIPIKRLIAGVEVIRDTEDKEELESHQVDTKTRDELAGLADTINEMTKGLVEAAKANKELTRGKEVQKMFIPLATDAGGRKLTTGVFQNDYIDVFGYYEGADALSGDYFDHIDLQNGFHAFIKCDVAGHGASASLIMVEVATIFTSYFRRYIGKKPNLNITELVNSINELLEERQFRGRFAALIIGLLELKTGKIYLCHAGDNLVHVYEESSRKVVVHTLPEAPATGIFNRDLIDMKGGYQQVALSLKSGDVVLFFTDGIEESHHRLRSADLKPLRYEDFSEELIAEDQRKIAGGFKDIKPEESFEEFDLKRVTEIVEAAMHRERYVLERRLDLVITEPLVFDFSSLTGTVEEMVLAMMAVEKVYRLVPDPNATERDRVRVDRKIADFLERHFEGYHRYFRNPVENENFPEYIWFSHLKEDEQDDDLTVLAVRRK